mmetsp:Transcript_3817/g.8093  ORF Transcript_3817/g.8093 Transcript_3817/m.8093 type:complete len:465 (-) Transcript_3817:97-1491(-)|eukprot:CAMPEP_0172443098 /NCGR_PEP_ID=MMETSP1065-20121228/3408_1 /TAXON_ID=265537 /ORGANISM="Amphiprora paludosa, Strain CCMP125" /LENGTH=464 /DNA_ID=CAMNT_0013193195 /DNA_START=48 /DNA_END=1442 /DNA_ORIENTATION=+
MMDNSTSIPEVYKDDDDNNNAKPESSQHRDDGGPFPGDDDFDDCNAPANFVVNEWAQGTSIHGVPFVTDSIMWLPWKRYMWIVLVCVSASFMIWQFTALITQYRTYEVITDSVTINPESLEFPEVSVCGLNFFSQSKINATGITQPKNMEEVDAISTSLEDFVKFMWFNGRELNVSQNWKPIVSDLGRCFSFTTDRRIYRPGYYGGLKIWVDLNQDDFNLETEYAGLAIMVQQPGTKLSTQLPVYAVKPAQESLVNLRKTEFVRERVAPWARCKGEAPEYTQTRCRTECVDQAIREQCNCRRFTDETIEGDIPFCSISSTSGDRECANEVLYNEKAAYDNCDCHLPSCLQTEYEGHVTEVDFANIYLDQIDYEGFGITREYLLSNFVSVTINYDRLQYNKLTETKAMTFADLLGAIGGSMGFFLGISMLSIFELIGDLGLLRLVPRLFGRKHLYGLGARRDKTD